MVIAGAFCSVLHERNVGDMETSVKHLHVTLHDTSIRSTYRRITSHAPNRAWV